MRIAWHPTNNSFVRASDVEREYGKKTPSLDDTYEAPPARCRLCSANLFLVKGNPRRLAHFRHPKQTACPTLEPSGKPYLRFKPTNPDLVSGARIRKMVLERWQELYAELQRLVPYFSPGEFKVLLRRATDLGTWDYRDLEFSDLARTLVLLADYPPWTGLPGRKLWFRFWYDVNIQYADELWIRQSEMPVLFRASFSPPSSRKSRPEYEDVEAIKDEWSEPEYIPSIRRSEIFEIDRWFLRHTRDFPPIR